MKFGPKDTAYAEIYVADNTTATAIPTGSAYTKLSLSDAAIGSVKNCTVSTANGNLIVQQSGQYLVVGAFSSKLGTTDVIWDTATFVNDVVQNNLHMRRRFSTSGYTFNVAISGIVDLKAGDVLDIRVKHNNGSSVNITNEYANISIALID